MLTKMLVQGLIAAGVIAGAGAAWTELSRPPLAAGGPGMAQGSGQDTGYAAVPSTTTPAAMPQGNPGRDTGYVALPQGASGSMERRWGDDDDDGDRRGGYRRDHDDDDDHGYRAYRAPRGGMVGGSLWRGERDDD